MRKYPLVLAMVASLAVATPSFADTRSEIRAELVGFSSARLARVDSAIEAAIRGGASPGAALAIARRGQIVRLRGYGRLTYAADAPAVTDSTLFDLASLTKVVGTTTAVMKLVDEGRLDLDIPIFQYLRAWPSEGLNSQVTLRHLLTHTSGLPAGADLWTTSGREAKISRIANMRLSAPPGTQTVYSDVGMIVIGAVVESITGERLDDYLEREVFKPLRLRETFFNAYEHMVDDTPRLAEIIVETVARSVFFAPQMLLAQWSDSDTHSPRMFAKPKRNPQGRMFDRTQVAPTNDGRRLGRVHDGTARSLEGVAGHAGLFSSARDMAVFAQVMLDAAAHGVDAPFSRSQTVSMFVSRGRNGRGLGWEMPSGKSSAGDYFPATAFGHTGFTGTSIWIDPERDLYVVLLTNRTFPTESNKKHVALRRAVHDAVELAVADELVARRSDQ